MYHKQLITCIESEHEYQQLTTNKLNQILHHSGELSIEYRIRRSNKNCDGSNTPEHKTIPANHTN